MYKTEKNAINVAFTRKGSIIRNTQAQEVNNVVLRMHFFMQTYSHFCIFFNFVYLIYGKQTVQCSMLLFFFFYSEGSATIGPCATTGTPKHKERPTDNKQRSIGRI